MNLFIKGSTKVYGILGWPVEHSFSPVLHNSAFQQTGLDCVYVPFPVKPADLARTMDGIRSMGISGVSVTIPHKSKVIDYLDEITPEAKLIGAVNTIVSKDGRLKGYNTDAPGFLSSLESEAAVSPADKKVLILGAGGAARAVAVQMALAGASEILITSKTFEKVESIVNLINHSVRQCARSFIWSETEFRKILPETDILINTTPVGMHPRVDEMPKFPLRYLPASALVCDLIYNPRETLLLKKSREQGCAAMNGMGMLLYQGAIAFELWTGVKPPIEVMKTALETVLTK